MSFGGRVSLGPPVGGICWPQEAANKVINMNLKILFIGYQNYNKNQAVPRVAPSPVFLHFVRKTPSPAKAGEGRGESVYRFIPPPLQPPCSICSS